MVVALGAVFWGGQAVLDNMHWMIGLNSTFNQIQNEFYGFFLRTQVYLPTLLAHKQLASHQLPEPEYQLLETQISQDIEQMQARFMNISSVLSVGQLQ